VSKQFDRQYRLSAGPAGGAGFEVGATSPTSPTALHIHFIVDKCDSENPNRAKISLWNLNPEQLAILNMTDCVVVLRAGYGNHMPLIFVGCVSFVRTMLDGADRETTIEAVDGRMELRDGYVSLSYSGTINTKKILQDAAAGMGLTVSFSYNAQFADLPNGFSYIGPGHVALDKACASSGLQWSIQNGVLQVKMRRDTMTREVYVLSPDSGLIGIPKRIMLGKDNTGAEDQPGWEVEYLLNGAIGIGDFVRLESDTVTGYFRLRSIELSGDNLEGKWMCTSKLMEA
jgi:hypothetical protein